MKTKNHPIIRIIIGIVITLMIMVSVHFIYGTIGNLINISNSQTSEEIKMMKNHSDEELLESLKETYQHQDSLIQTTKGIITINRSVSYQELTYVTPGYSVFSLATQAINSFFILFVLFIIYQIFRTALSGEVFIINNVKRIRKISWLLLGYISFILLNGLFGNTLLTYFFNSSLNKPAIEMNFETIFPLLFLVLIIFGLSEFFRTGVNMKEENDLTI